MMVNNKRTKEIKTDGRVGNRTLDLQHAKLSLYQLSYTPPYDDRRYFKYLNNTFHAS